MPARRRPSRYTGRDVARYDNIDYQARAIRLHPSWPLCPVCQWPIDPAALLDFDGNVRWDRHPTCPEVSAVG